MTMTETAIELHELTRSYGRGKSSVHALYDVSLAITEGSVVALLGENGAGKTTLTKILSTQLLPTRGTATVFGHDVVRSAKQVRALTTAVFGGDRGLYGLLTGTENLWCFGSVAGVPNRELRKRIPEVLAQVGLDGVSGRQTRNYSKGMRQRLHIAIGLLAHASILLLDEPTVGLDPNEAERLRATVAAMRGDGTTVLLTSHNLADIDQLADRVVVIDRGRLRHDMSILAFRSLAGERGVIDVTVDASATAFLESTGAKVLARAGGRAQVAIAVERWTPDVFRHLATVLEESNIHGIKLRGASLEEAFAKVTHLSDGAGA